jgi:hypothetical protein
VISVIFFFFVSQWKALQSPTETQTKAHSSSWKVWGLTWVGVREGGRRETEGGGRVEGEGILLESGGLTWLGSGRKKVRRKEEVGKEVERRKEEGRGGCLCLHNHSSKERRSTTLPNFLF